MSTDSEGVIESSNNNNKNPQIGQIQFWILLVLSTRLSTNVLKVFQQNRKGRNTFKVIIQSQYCSDTKWHKIIVDRFPLWIKMKSTQTFASQIQQHIKKIIQHDQVVFI
jgi:hypothetical protein